MTYHRIIKLVLITMACLSLLACAKHYQTYDGPPKGKNEIAMLVGIHKYASFKNEDAIVRIVAVDEKQGFKGSGWDGGYEIELLPGLHEILVQYRGYGLTSTKIKLIFTADAGQAYTVKPNLSKDFKSWAPSIINITDKYK